MPKGLASDTIVKAVGMVKIWTDVSNAPRNTMGNQQPSPKLGCWSPSMDAVHRLNGGGSLLKRVANS